MDMNMCMCMTVCLCCVELHCKLCSISLLNTKSTYVIIFVLYYCTCVYVFRLPKRSRSAVLGPFREWASLIGYRGRWLCVGGVGMRRRRGSFVPRSWHCWDATHPTTGPNGTPSNRNTLNCMFHLHVHTNVHVYTYMYISYLVHVTFFVCVRE